MNEQEARAVAAVIVTADGECLYCVADLACRLDSADLGPFDWFGLAAGESLGRWSMGMIRGAACGEEGDDEEE